MDHHLNIAIRAALAGGVEIMKIYAGEITVAEKEDASPLTEADQRANEAINQLLKPTEIPIISEENKQTDFLIRKSWSQCWIVDPLDGTKEFIKRNGEFTVNIALIADGKPVLGVIYVPVSRELYFGQVPEQQAFKVTLPADTELDAAAAIRQAKPIRPAENDKTRCRVVGSRSHMSEDTLAFMEGLKSKYDTLEVVSKGSSLKFCLVAEGAADIYPRYAPTMEWDTAAGQAICEAVGLKVISRATNAALQYNKEDLLNPFFVVRHPELVEG